MKLVGVLCWYDENPAWLAACIASMARAGVQHLVALDGAYVLYPGGRASSPVEQHDIIVQTARGAGLGLTLHAPDDLWLGNEVEKRTFGFRLAETVTTEDDWVFLMDADQIITSAIGLREHLEDTTLDVGEVRFHDSRVDPLFSGYPVRCVFRALRGVHLAGNHYTYLAADGRCLAGQSMTRNPSQEAAVDLSFVQIEHRTKLDNEVRRQAQLGYYRHRDHAGIEREQVAA